MDDRYWERWFNPEVRFSAATLDEFEPRTFAELRVGDITTIFRLLSGGAQSDYLEFKRPIAVKLRHAYRRVLGHYRKRDIESDMGWMVADPDELDPLIRVDWLDRFTHEVWVKKRLKETTKAANLVSAACSKRWSATNRAQRRDLNRTLVLVENEAQELVRVERRLDAI